MRVRPDVRERRILIPTVTQDMLRREILMEHSADMELLSLFESGGDYTAERYYWQGTLHLRRAHVWHLRIGLIDAFNESVRRIVESDVNIARMHYYCALSCVEVARGACASSRYHLFSSDPALRDQIMGGAQRELERRALELVEREQDLYGYPVPLFEGWYGVNGSIHCRDCAGMLYNAEFEDSAARPLSDTNGVICAYCGKDESW